MPRGPGNQAQPLRGARAAHPHPQPTRGAWVCRSVFLTTTSQPPSPHRSRRNLPPLPRIPPSSPRAPASRRLGSARAGSLTRVQAARLGAAVGGGGAGRRVRVGVGEPGGLGLPGPALVVAGLDGIGPAPATAHPPALRARPAAARLAAPAAAQPRRRSPGRRGGGGGGGGIASPLPPARSQAPAAPRAASSSRCAPPLGLRGPPLPRPLPSPSTSSLRASEPAGVSAAAAGVMEEGGGPRRASAPPGWRYSSQGPAHPSIHTLPCSSIYLLMHLSSHPSFPPTLPPPLPSNQPSIHPGEN